MKIKTQGLGIGLIVSLVIASVLLIVIYTPTEQAGSISFSDPKYYPSDHFLLERSWPELHPDMKALDQAISVLKQRDAFKMQSIPGFSGPWQLEGPTNIGGRINCLLVHPANPDIIYVGCASGGIFKSLNGGVTWVPIFDDQSYIPIGTLVFDPGNPNTIYAGTGDPNISGTPFVGDGIWRSTDAGVTWQHVGLTDQRIISRIVVNPVNTQEIYAATMGLPFERNVDRGLYKSIDGGLSWSKILFIGDDAGIIDLVMDPVNPQILYAAGWNRIRNNQESLISGPAARIYKTTDGGQTWNILAGGLPQTDMSRIGIAISETSPSTLYAIYVNPFLDLEGIYKSTNSGATWTLLPLNGLDPNFLGGFGWYFGRIVVDPSNADHVYVCGVDIFKTFNGGMSWIDTDPNFDTHADKHDVWFVSPTTQLLATDGGLYKTVNSGQTWSDLDLIPNNQFYRIVADPHSPGTFTGGLQDNGTVTGNYSVVDSWLKIFGADGFQPVYDPTDPDKIFVETQNGGLYSSDDGGSNFNWAGDGIDNNDRRNWDMQYFMSSHDPDVLYTGTFRVYKNISGTNAFWNPISPDLTDGIVFSPRFHTITTLCESQVSQGKLYAGTSDGNVWHSPNDGGVWTNMSAGLPDRYVTCLKASPDILKPNTVYVTVSGYKYNEQIPHVFRSDNNGSTWLDITGDLPPVAANDIVVLPGSNDQILFLATDGGVFGTLDAGIHWERIGNNLPVLPVYDIDVDLNSNMLVAGTHGRSAYSFPVDSLILSVGISESYSSQKVKIWPSFTAEALYFSGTEDYTTIQIYSSSGRLHLEFLKNEISGSTIDVAKLPAGVYFFNMINSKNKQTLKFVKL